MKRSKLLWLAALLVSCSPSPADEPARGVRPLSVAPSPAAQPVFAREQSAALFVGIRTFADAPSLAGVQYTVDDAVDLAYTFALERKVSLVEPRRVVLALTHDPQKAESQQRLEKLLAAGAIRTIATRDEVLRRLEQQADAAGEAGLLILSFASHGFTRDGTPYVLASTSRYDDPESSLSAAKVLDIAAMSRAQRSLIFIDACRERVSAARRAAAPAPAALVQSMKGAIGQVVFYASAPGRYAYEDERARNGVFTNAVITGLLECNARTIQGLVTVDTLARYVEDRVGAWIRKHRDPSIVKATQVSMDADSQRMPLASCTRPPSPAAVSTAGASLTASAIDTSELWRRTLESPITQSAVADVEGDGTNEVLVSGGSVITVFDAFGEQVWSIDTKLPVRTFRAERLFSIKRGLQIVAVSANDGRSTVSLVDRDGTLLAAYTYPGEVQQVVVDRITARHDTKVIVSASGGRVFMIDPDAQRRRLPPYLARLGSGGEVWAGTVLPASLTQLTVIDYDNDGRREIALSTPQGRVYVAFDGRTIESKGAHFELLAPRRRGRPASG